MPEVSDMILVRQYADFHSEPAFAELVRRHVNLVYSVALRRTGNAADAQDVAQAVFIILAQKAAGLRSRPVLTGWLYETTRFTSARLLRTRVRQQTRDQEAYMQSTLNEPDAGGVWRQLAPHLEDAMTRLGERDRTLLALRFFENKSTPEAAAALGINEAAAHKRTRRALDKLRHFFSRRGIVLSAAAIAGAVSANSVQAAPAGLAKTISTVALAKGAAAGGSTLTLVKGALKIMAWTKAKTVIIAGVVVLLAAGTTTVVVEKIVPRYYSADKYLQETGNDWKTFEKIPPYYLVVRPTHFGKELDKTFAMGSPDRTIGRNMDLETMIEYAYWYHNRTRTILPAEALPAERFDFLVTVPNGPQKLQAIIKNQYGYAAHQELVETNVLLLKVRRSKAPGLQPADAGGTDAEIPGQFIDLPASQIEELAFQLENYEEIPIIDQTGLTGNYNIHLDWQKARTPEARAKLRQAVLDQLGLELVPTNLPVEMFVVEKTK